MMKRLGVRRLAVVLAAVAMIPAFGSGTAGATELGDHLWQSRPLLLFAPTERDPRLVETLGRIAASRCDFDGRDMVLGVVTEGNGTLDGQALDDDEVGRLRNRFAIGENAFGVVLIGKDGGEKWRVDEVPDLRRIYDVIDGMPMRSRETGRGPC